MNPRGCEHQALQCGSKFEGEHLVPENFLIGNDAECDCERDPYRLPAERDVIVAERTAAKVAAQQQAEADAEREKQEAAEQQRVEEAREKKRSEGAAAKKKAEQFAPRKAGGTNNKSKGGWR